MEPRMFSQERVAEGLATPRSLRQPTIKKGLGAGYSCASYPDKAGKNQHDRR
jgi:hypothetical protein